MARTSGTGQLRKIFYNKEYSDEKGVIWKLSTWKILAWMIAIMLILIIFYSFFIDEQTAFLKEMLFYSIMTIIIIMIVWVIGNIILKGRKIFIGFILAWILIFSFYVITGAIFAYVNLMNFHYGASVWIIITCLAFLGARRLDSNLDKNDFFFGLLVVIVLIMGNAPVFNVGGFYAQVDTFLGWIAEKLSLVNPQNFVAN